MTNKIEYQKFKIGNKEVESNLPKGLLSEEEIKQIENIAEETRKKVDKKLIKKPKEV